MGGKVFALISLDELQIDNSYQRLLQNLVKIIAILPKFTKTLAIHGYLWYDDRNL